MSETVDQRTLWDAAKVGDPFASLPEPEGFVCEQPACGVKQGTSLPVWVFWTALHLAPILVVLWAIMH